jgi:hypothetical protein
LAAFPAIFSADETDLSYCLIKVGADFNGDCIVDINDLTMFAEQWLSTGTIFGCHKRRESGHERFEHRVQRMATERNLAAC